MRRIVLALIGVGSAVLLVGVTLSGSDTVGDELREQFAKLSPYRLAAVVGAVGFGVAVLSFARAAGVSWPAGSRLARGVRLRLAAIPAGLALPLIVGIVAALRISLSHAAALPSVFGDELIYADLAKSFADHGTLDLRGEPDYGHSLLYPILISPAYVWAADGVEAFRAVQVMNAILVASVAVPAYYLARRVVTHGWSMGVALLSAVVPASAYSALVMTESFFYPAFVATALALTVTLERPTFQRQLLTVAAVLVLVGIRTQALALLPAVATAVAIDGLRTASLRRRLAVFWPAWGAFAGIAVLALIASQVGAEAPTGAYGSLLDTYNPVDVARWAVWTVADYELAVGVVPLAALPLALARLLRPNGPEAERALGATTLGLVVWIVVSVVVLSASPYGLDVLHQRSLFFVTPLVLTCFAYWLAHGLWRPLSPTLGIAVTSLAIVLALPPRLFLSAAYVDAPTNVIWVGLSERVTDVPVKWFVIGAAILGATVFLRARTAVLPLLCFVTTILFVTANFVPTATMTRDDARRLGWVDGALPDDARATIVHVAVDSALCPSGPESYQGEAVAWTEFFNKSVDRVYGALGEVRDDGLATPQVAIDPDGRLTRNGASLAPDYAVVDSRVRLVGTELATLNLHEISGFDSTKPGSLTLWRPEQPLRLVFPGPLLDGRPELLACPATANQ